MPAETHSGGGDTRTTDEIVVTAVAEVSESQINELDADTDLEALGIGGLVLLDVIDAVTDELGDRSVGFDVDEDELARVRSLGDLVRLFDRVDGP